MIILLCVWYRWKQQIKVKMLIELLTESLELVYTCFEFKARMWLCRAEECHFCEVLTAGAALK